MVVFSPLYLTLLRPWAIFGVAAAVLAVAPIRAVLRGDTGPALVGVLIATGRLQIAVGALLTVGLALGT